MPTLIDLVIGFALNIVVVFVIVRFIYYPRQRNKDYVFTFFTFSVVIFFVMGLLGSSEISVGVGFGLFAIFSILRYRTDTIPIREMTYLFVLIALSVLNSILLRGQDYAEFAAVNVLIIVILYALEKGWGFRYETHKNVIYERIDMIRPENWSLLLDDLRQRTGLPISRVEVGRLDFLRDTAEIKIYYDARMLKTGEVSFATNGDVRDYAAQDD